MNNTLLKVGNSLRRVEKIDEGAAFVEANIQSSIPGIAAGGTCRKLLRSDSTIGSIGVSIGESNSAEEISNNGVLTASFLCR